MRIKQAVPFLFSVAALTVSGASCSSTPSASERYIGLDYDTKTVFLTYYPYLSPEQRDQLLSNNDKNPRELIQDWAGQFNDPNKEVGSFDEMMNNPKNRKITELQIKLESPEPITTGDHVAVHAFALYSNGRKTEVTQDTEWKVEPRLGEMIKNELQYECVNSDLTVTGTFLGEKETEKTIALRKPLQSLELKVSEAFIGVDTGYNFQLTLLAHCKDGTVSDVSCQANWKSVATSGKIQGCGNFIVTSKEQLAEDALTVTATYGDLSVRKTLHPPIR